MPRAPGEKIRISGGGRCNFTNVNPPRSPTASSRRTRNFAVSALSRYTPQNFIELVKAYGIAFHEKTLGQLFCDGSSVQIVNLLTSETGQGRRQAGTGRPPSRRSTQTEAGFARAAVDQAR